MRLYFIANVRMPTEKAHGIQIAKMCEAFVEAGVDLVLVVPRRGVSRQSVRDFYSLRVDIPIKRLPAINLYSGGRVLYRISSLSFLVSYFLYIFFCVSKKNAVIYTVDLDHFSYGAIPFLGIPFFSEMHGGKPDSLVHRRLFKKAQGIIATNEITKEQLQKMFSLPSDRLLVEPNGVDFSSFALHERASARKELALPEPGKLVLYVGRIFAWKGLGILAEAAERLPAHITLGFVGGSATEFTDITGKPPPARVVFYGDQPYKRIPLWLSAADALLVLGTKEDEQSYQYTSPMKLFEYMAMKRPIIASRTPALQKIISDDACYFYEPDNAENLAHTITQALEASDQEARTLKAYQIVGEHTWAKRAERIRRHMNRFLQSKSV
jgi:glycosyltransferase involved in cell wall biosynthesis